jgi:hypothetical protein
MRWMEEAAAACGRAIYFRSNPAQIRFLADDQINELIFPALPGNVYFQVLS